LLSNKLNTFPVYVVSSSEFWLKSPEDMKAVATAAGGTPSVPFANFGGYGQASRS
jgi:hypothetical protein